MEENKCILTQLFFEPQDNTIAARGYKDTTPAVQRGIAWKPGGGFGWHEIGKMERPHYNSKRWNDVQAKVHSLRMPGRKTPLSPKKARKIKPLLHRSPTVGRLWDVYSLKKSCSKATVSPKEAFWIKPLAGRSPTVTGLRDQSAILLIENF